nr:Ig-like domain-containing protein [Candidatus Njordarchaeum guaymaensis]
MKARKSTYLATIFLVFCFFSLSIPSDILAAALPTLSLSINKRFGYAMFSDIAGSLTLVASVSSDVIRVEFYLDGQLKLNDAATPFQWEFDTTDYSLGQHIFEAIAYNSAGEYAHASRTANFVEAPMPPYYFAFLALTLGTIIILVVIFRVIPISRGKGKKGGQARIFHITPTRFYLSSGKVAKEEM